MSVRFWINQMINKGASIAEIAREYPGPIHLKETALALAITQQRNSVVSEAERIKELTMGESDPWAIPAKQARMILAIAKGSVQRIVALLKELTVSGDDVEEVAQLISLITGDWTEQAVLIYNFTTNDETRNALIVQGDESDLMNFLRREHIKKILAQNPTEQVICESEIAIL